METQGIGIISDRHFQREVKDHCQVVKGNIISNNNLVPLPIIK